MPDAAALQILDRAADASRNRSDLLAVAEAAARLAGGRVWLGTAERDRPFAELAVRLYAKAAPESLAYSVSLTRLGEKLREEHFQTSRPELRTAVEAQVLQLEQRAFEVAQRAAPASREVASAGLALGHSLLWAKQPAAAIAPLLKANAWYQQHHLKDTDGEPAWTLYGLASAYRAVGRPQDAEQIEERYIRAMARTAAPDRNALIVLHGLRESPHRAGDWRRELYVLREAEKAWTRSMAPDRVGRAGMCRTAMAWCYVQLGDLRAARRLMLSVSPPDYFGLAYTTDDPEVQKTLLERGLADKDPNASWTLGFRDFLVDDYLELGQVGSALEILRTSVQALERDPRADPLPTYERLLETTLAQGDLTEARAWGERAKLRCDSYPTPARIHSKVLFGLARVIDESGARREALGYARKALDLALTAGNAGELEVRERRMLARLLIEAGEPGAEEHLKRADAIEESLRQITRQRLRDAIEVPLPGIAEPTRIELGTPRCLILSPREDDTVVGSEVECRLLFLAPLPLARYRLWINGRPFGPKAGFELPASDEKGRLLDKGRLLEKGDHLGAGQVFEKGRLLEKGEDREQLAMALPADVADLVRQPRYAHFVQIRQTVPLEDTDGELVRIAVQGETSAGSVSAREVLRLRRPQAEQQRGSLRVLSVGISDYALLPKLKYAAADALSFADAFRHQGSGDAGVSLYRGGDVRSLVNGDATLGRIREALDQLAAGTRPGDTVVLALSGHGIAVRPPSANFAGASVEAMMAAKTEPPQTYFAPVRFDPENPAGTGLPWSEIVSKLEPLRKVAKTVWVLADCCRSAPGLRRIPTPDMPLRRGEVLAADTRDLKRGLDEGGNLILCAASDAETPSYESDDLKHGIFTQAWLEVLRGEAPDVVYQEVPRGRVLTLSGLQFWLDVSVTRHARKTGVRQRVEFPRLEGSFSPSMPVFVPASP